MRKCFLLLLLTSCAAHRQQADTLAAIHIVDRNGFSETITTPERIKQYEQVDFANSQPYQKVLRVYRRDRAGDVRASLMTYHPNGQLKQSLEGVNSRAFGNYREWHANGQLKLEATLVGGEMSLHEGAESSWLFDGSSRAWDEAGHLIAEIPYSKGKLEGESLYYYSTGQLFKRVPFQNNEINGTFEVYRPSGELLEEGLYLDGKLDGKLRRWWSSDQLAVEEEYRKGALITGRYTTKEGEPIGGVSGGNGWRAVFGERLEELQEHQEGRLEGEVRQFGAAGEICSTYRTKGGLKEGEEIEYCLLNGEMQPKLQINWHEGKIQGTVKSWYDNGVLESQREMSNNAKNGLAMAWFPNGHLMLIEEYAKDLLVKGEYYKPGEKRPVSTVAGGEGVATLFDEGGRLVRKIEYRHGIPFLE